MFFEVFYASECEGLRKYDIERILEALDYGFLIIEFGKYSVKPNWLEIAKEMKQKYANLWFPMFSCSRHSRKASDTHNMGTFLKQ